MFFSCCFQFSFWRFFNILSLRLFIFSLILLFSSNFYYTLGLYLRKKNCRPLFSPLFSFLSASFSLHDKRNATTNQSCRGFQTRGWRMTNYIDEIQWIPTRNPRKLINRLFNSDIFVEYTGNAASSITIAAYCFQREPARQVQLHFVNLTIVQVYMKP